MLRVTAKDCRANIAHTLQGQGAAARSIFFTFISQELVDMATKATAKAAAGVAAAGVAAAGDTFIQLKHGACTDAAHDFHKRGFNKTREEKKNPGLPEVLRGLQFTGMNDIDRIPGGADAATKLRDETEVLQDLLSQFGLNTIQPIGENQGNIMEAITNALYAQTNPVNVNNFYEHNFKLNTIQGTPTDYRVQLLSKELEKGGKPERNLKLCRKKLTTDDYIKFFGTNDLNVIIDAQTIGWNSILCDAKNGLNGLQVSSLINREIVNDPATKTYSLDSVRMRPFSQDDKLQLNLKFDDYKGDITYSRTMDNTLQDTELQRDKLFSIYDFRLSPLQGPPTSVPTISLDIINPESGVIHHSDNPKKTNNIANCWAIVLNLFKSQASKRINASAQFQCKRSGDWLQALACLDTKRMYKVNDTENRESAHSITLVTHDRVLLWYALFLGINVLFTYKVNPPRAAGAAPVVDDEDEDDPPNEDTGPEDTGSEGISQSEKILISFKNIANTETPKQRSDRITAKINLLSRKMREYEIYTGNYNQWINEIKNDRINKINTTFQLWEEENRTNKTVVTNHVQDLLRAYWEFTLLDYKPMTPYYRELDDTLIAYNAEQNAEAKLVKAETFISYSINFETKMNSIKTKSDIDTDSKAYQNDKAYKQMVELMTKDRPSRTTGEYSIDTRAIMTYEYLRRLPPDLFQRLTEQLKIIQTELHKKDTAKYVLDIFLAKCNATTDAIENDAVENVIKETSEVIIERLQEDPSKYTNDEKEEPIEATQNKIKNVKKIQSIGKTIKEFAQRVFNKPKRAAAAKKGGGDPDPMENEIECPSRSIVLCYIYELMNTILGFDSADGDYVYYDSLSRIVLSLFPHVAANADDYDRIQAILYDVLPYDTWHTDDFLRPIFSRNVSTAAYNIALQSINMRDGVIESLGNSGSITTPIIDKYKKLTNTLAPMSFEDRQLAIFTKFTGLVKMPLQIAATKGVVPPSRLQTGYTARQFFSKAPAATKAHGGNRTRKGKQGRNGLAGRKGSPRRRTIKRTRKLR